MKLIIDVPEDKDYTKYFGCMSQQLDKTLNEGIPLDKALQKIKVEIENELKDISTHFDVLEVGANRAFLRTLRIIDKYRKGVSP